MGRALGRPRPRPLTARSTVRSTVAREPPLATCGVTIPVTRDPTLTIATTTSTIPITREPTLTIATTTSTIPITREPTLTIATTTSTIPITREPTLTTGRASAITAAVRRAVPLPVTAIDSAIAVLAIPITFALAAGIVAEGPPTAGGSFTTAIVAGPALLAVVLCHVDVLFSRGMRCQVVAPDMPTNARVYARGVVKCETPAPTSVGRAFRERSPAVSYSPTGSPLQYHRR
ncbi:hypothetical protein GCM10011490_00010 [Pseudoclavibacter endophyticus]|uniref:hypothetical protein n=1 Tax=Pseudoclavibacter endophyticus TaxID=1778590 RepID=UPI00166BDAA5|nr:hypothetical protein [Pseudoclavibacter endophyticus]GGA54262.1 hypothetical protein GCM10011490_00010 [Pseudoclavibacter endophyticus]